MSLLGAILLGFAQPVAAMAVAPPHASPVPAANALELAGLMAPRDLMIAAELREYDKNFVATLQANGEMKALEDQYPGLFDAMHKASRPLVETATNRAITLMHAKTSKLIQERLSTAETTELTGFYRSPLGRKVVVQMIGAADASDMYRQALDQPERDVTPEDMNRQIAASARKTAKQLSAEERIEMVKFMTTPGFAKLAAIRPEILKIMTEATNAPDPELDKRIEEVMSAAIEQHIARAAGSSK